MCTYIHACTYFFSCTLLAPVERFSKMTSGDAALPLKSNGTGQQLLATRTRDTSKRKTSQARGGNNLNDGYYVGVALAKRVRSGPKCKVRFAFAFSFLLPLLFCAARQ